MKEIEISWWLFQGSTLLACFRLPWKSHHEISISSISLKSMHQIGTYVGILKVVNCWKKTIVFHDTINLSYLAVTEAKYKIQDLLHHENDSKPFLLLKFDQCIPNKKTRKSLNKVKRRIQRNQDTEKVVENNYLFPSNSRQKREVLNQHKGRNSCHLEKLKVSVQGI